jgi:AraC-like DNA-binding protein
MSGSARPYSAPRSSCTFDEIDSNSLPPAVRFAQWRETGLLPMVAEPVDEAGRRGFRIQVRKLSGPAARFADLTATSMQLTRTRRDCHRDGLDMVSLTLVLGVTLECRFGSGSAVPVRPGQILVKDFTRPANAAWHNGSHRGFNLHLPRHTVEAAIGDKIVRLHGSILSSVGLAPMLRAQLMSLAKIAPRADGAVRAAALDAAAELAGSVLRCELGARIEDEANDAGLFAAAQIFVRRNLGSPRLNPQLIALQLRCSRAHLYRVFSARGETVAGYVRDLRLQRARELLAAAAHRPVRVGEIAYACGFEDPVHFTRLFRERFGQTPRAFKVAFEASQPGERAAEPVAPPA